VPHVPLSRCCLLAHVDGYVVLTLVYSVDVIFMFLVCATLVVYNAPCVQQVSEFCSKGTLIPELPVK
jgi:hypothetical protein